MIRPEELARRAEQLRELADQAVDASHARSLYGSGPGSGWRWQPRLAYCSAIPSTGTSTTASTPSRCNDPLVRSAMISASLGYAGPSYRSCRRQGCHRCGFRGLHICLSHRRSRARALMRVRTGPHPAHPRASLADPPKGEAFLLS
jgi:hypothetical protein